jgi:hypothetical protein
MRRTVWSTASEPTSSVSTFLPELVLLDPTGGLSVREFPPLSRGARSLGVSRDAAWVDLSLVRVVTDLCDQITFQRDPASFAWIAMHELPILLDLAGAIDNDEGGFTAAIKSSFDNEPLEDGRCHSAETLLKMKIAEHPSESLQRLRSLVLDPLRPVLGASVLRCLGRLDSPGTPDWRSRLVKDALNQPDVELRDAAIQAAELWVDKQVIEVLRAHHESEPWLGDYLQRVISQLVK